MMVIMDTWSITIMTVIWILTLADKMLINSGVNGQGEAVKQPRVWPGPGAGAIRSFRGYGTNRYPPMRIYTTDVRVHWEVAKNCTAQKGEAFYLMPGSDLLSHGKPHTTIGDASFHC